MSPETPTLPRPRTDSLNDVRAIIPGVVLRAIAGPRVVGAAAGGRAVRRSRGRSRPHRPLVALLVLWLLAGLGVSGLFVLGHDASHGALLDSRRAEPGDRPGVHGAERARRGGVGPRPQPHPPRLHHPPGLRLRVAPAHPRRVPGAGPVRPGCATASSGRSSVPVPTSCARCGGRRCGASTPRASATTRSCATRSRSARRSCVVLGGAGGRSAPSPGGWLDGRLAAREAVRGAVPAVRAHHRLDRLRAPRRARHPLVDRGRSGRSSRARWSPPPSCACPLS